MFENALSVNGFSRSAAVCLMAIGCALPTVAQTAVWRDGGGSAFQSTTAASYLADLWCAGQPLVNCNMGNQRNNMVSGFLGHSFGNFDRSDCWIDNCKNDGQSVAQLLGDGLGSPVATIGWRLDANTFNSCECNRVLRGSHLLVTADTMLNTTVSLRVETTPPGQVVQVNIGWWAMVLVDFEPELGAEDEASINGVALEVNGVNYVPRGFRNIDNGIKGVGYFGVPGGGSLSFTAAHGQVFQIRLAGVASAFIRRPGVWDNFAYSDGAAASFIGELTISIDQYVPSTQNPAYMPNWFADFSLDIGSDREMSDPTLDGNELFDPGDQYAWNVVLPTGGADGVVDDTLIFAADYWPVAPDGPLATTGARTCAGLAPADIQQMLNERFDLDGGDALDVSLFSMIPQWAPTMIPQFTSSCIHRPDHLTISFDDDGAAHYAGLGCDVPASSPSPTGATYGTTLKRDELMGVVLNETWSQFAGTTPMSLQSVFPVADETMVHSQLAPNPDTRESADDDIDALVIGERRCEYRYFSADHEATGWTTTFGSLDPGAIYEIVNYPPGAGIWKVVDPAIHLGLLPGVDIDAFDFVWLPPCEACPPVLTLIFSVNEDDYRTFNVDESGGLDARKIYASNLGGFSFELVAASLADDIDAISATPRPWMPVPCDVPPHVPVFYEDFENYPPLTGIHNQGGWQAVNLDPTNDALVDTQQSNSGLNSLLVTTSSNVFHPLAPGPSTTHSFIVRTYVPTGVTGTSELALHDALSPGGVLGANAVEVRIRAVGGIVRESFGGNSQPIIYDDWVPVRVDIDLVNDAVSVYYGGMLLVQRTWSRGGLVQPQVRAVSVRGSSGMWYDDFSFKTIDDCDRNGIDDACDVLSADCNSNGSPDTCDIWSGTSQDSNLNGVPDECEPQPPCIGDVNGDGRVDLADLAILLAHFGMQSGATAADGDLDGDGDVDINDLAILLARFGTIC